jgi:putative CocE/NonD family hydrolase
MAQNGTIKQLHVHVPMRDGVLLSTNVFRPAAAGTYGTILIRTPYGIGSDISVNHQAFVDHGYAVVVQDVRGRHDSQGEFRPLEQEGPDGSDTLNWIARQPWSNGKVAMTGGSYLGMVQWRAALENNPHLKAIFAWTSGDDDYRDRFYSPGGAMKLGHRMLWVEENLRDPLYDAPDFQKYILTLPMRNMDTVVTGRHIPLVQTALDHPDYDSYWDSLSVRKQLRNIHIPVFSVGGWYDNYVASDLDAWSVLAKSSGVHRILIGPWPHNVNTRMAGADFGRDSTIAFRRTQMEWFDQWLKDKDVPMMSTPPVRIFVMGSNQWRDMKEWPPAGMKPTKFYLESGGHANTLNGNGVLNSHPSTRSPADQFVFDPHNPVPTHGGSVCCDPKIFPWGPMDQRPVEKRNDVLVYSTPPLQEDLEITGPVQVVLSAASSAPDTDFTAKLVDVYPDGTARNLTDGIQRARYRKSLSKPELLKPGFIYEYRIDAGVTSSVFLKGHRIRIEISSSNFPRFDRNPNTGRPIAAETELRTAAQTIYHDRFHESYALLPVVRDSKKLENSADQLKHTLSHQQARPGDPPAKPGNLKSYK